MPLKTTRWDVTEHLNTEESVALFLEEMVSDGDAKLIIAAINDVARGRGLALLAKDAGISREALYRVLCDDENPDWAILNKLLSTLGLRAKAAPAA